MWTMMTIGGVKALAQIPRDSRTVLRYEDLLDDPRGQLTALAGYIGVPADPDWVDRSCRLIHDRRGTATATLDPAALAELRAICAPGMQALASLKT